MFTNSSSTNPRDNFLNNVDVFAKTKHLEIGDINKAMDKQDRDDKYKNENLYIKQDRKHIYSQQGSPERGIINDMDFKKNLMPYETNSLPFEKNKHTYSEMSPKYESSSYSEKTPYNDVNSYNDLNSYGDNQESKRNVDLDLSVPISSRENLGIPIPRGANSFLIKSPDFFKRVHNHDEKKSHETRNQEKYPNYVENKIHYEKPTNDARFNRNRSLHNATLNQQMSPGFFYQNELFNQYNGDNEQVDGFYMSQENYPSQQDIKSQSNNLFGQPFMNFNKKRSYSEADLNKTSRNNPFLNFRRSSQFNDDFYKKSSRPISETCIDPRMFYKNICANQISNKENHAKPAFSYAKIITRALNGSPDGKLTLGEIYKWIEENFEYYKFANPVWKNSIRHNLSLSKCFKKVAREPGTRGKGGKWMIDKEFIAQEENRKKRKSFEEENMMNHPYSIDNTQDPRFYQM